MVEAIGADWPGEVAGAAPERALIRFLAGGEGWQAAEQQLSGAFADARDDTVKGCEGGMRLLFTSAFQLSFNGPGLNGSDDQASNSLSRK